MAQAPGSALADFYIFKLVAEAWGCPELFDGWDTPEDVFQSLKALSRGTRCDFSGIADYRMIDELGGIQWPFPEGSSPMDTPAERRLFADGRFFHPDGRARFVFEATTRVREATSPTHPFVLLTGRGSSSQWHTGTRTSKSPLLKTLAPQTPWVEISVADAATLGIEPNDRVVVSSSRGSMRATAFVTTTVAPGQLFVAMHYAETNQLTDSSFDPYSRQPSYKHCAVNIRVATTADR